MSLNCYGQRLGLNQLLSEECLECTYSKCQLSVCFYKKQIKTS